ncbi:MAG: redoxin domain-containing protein [Polyangiaceae bacterium]
MTHLRVGAALLFALVAGCGAGARELPLWERPGLYGAERPEMGRPQPGDAAPDFELPREGGGTFRSDSLRGSWVVIHFTASWCPYCDAEVEHLGALSSEYESRGVKVALVDIEEDAERWTAYAKTHVAPSVVALRDGTGEVARRFAPPRAQPSFQDRAQVMLDSTLILDPAGEIRLFLFPDTKHFDPTFAAVRDELDRLLGPVTMPPEKVVSVELGTVSGTGAGGQREIVVRLRVAHGYHLMSDRPSAPEYVATRIVVDRVEGLTWSEPRYPPPTALALADKVINTFEGDVEVRLPFEVTASETPRRRAVRGTLRYQACTKTSCLFPVTRAFEVEVP